jgi:hypothetical protein
MRHPALKGDSKSVSPAEHQHAPLRGSKKAFPCQNAHILAERGIVGEEQESSPASGEPRESAKHLLLQRDCAAAHDSQEKAQSDSGGTGAADLCFEACS